MLLLRRGAGRPLARLPAYGMRAGGHSDPRAPAAQGLAAVALHAAEYPMRCSHPPLLEISNGTQGRGAGGMPPRSRDTTHTQTKGPRGRSAHTTARHGAVPPSLGLVAAQASLFTVSSRPLPSREFQPSMTCRGGRGVGQEIRWAFHGAGGGRGWHRGHQRTGSARQGERGSSVD